MKFYIHQDSYSFYDTKHIKQLLTWISNASKDRCGGWNSPAVYKFCNKIEFDCTKTGDILSYDEYITIWRRKLDEIPPRISHDEAFTFKIQSKWILLNKKYKIKLGFYKVGNERSFL